jgi:ABC-2 type transport system permease protein
MLRNRRTVIITLILPTLLYLMIGTNASYSSQSEGSGNVSAYILISMAAYGAVLASTSGGAMVATERALGWSRQLRLTPLSPVVYILVKSIVALALGALSVVAVNVVGAVNGKATMPTHVWITAALIAWAGSVVFGAFGLFMGYLLPSENVMQIIGFVLMLCSFTGGLFIPLSQFSDTWRTIAAFTPLWGLNGLVHAALQQGGFDWVWPVNLLVWLAVFVVGAAWRFSRDTARV